MALVQSEEKLKICQMFQKFKIRHSETLQDIEAITLEFLNLVGQVSSELCSYSIFLVY